MTDHNGIDERLRRAGRTFRAEPVPDVALTWPAPARRGRILAPIAIAAAVALVVAGVAIGLNIRHSAAPASPATPTPAVPATPDPNFAVAPPPDYHIGAPSLVPVATCRVSTLHASARTRETADGIVGVISVTGGDMCSITPDLNSIRLRDAHGRLLEVRTSHGNVVNQPPGSPSYAYGVTTGRMPSGGKHAPALPDLAARIGFAWSGSYCGPAAATIEIRIQGQPVRAPISGPGLSCRPHPASTLIPGTLGGPGSAVVPPPVSWRALRARVVLAPTFTPGPIPVVVVLTNAGSTPVALSDPCPTYVARGMLDSGGDGAGFGLPQASLCDLPRVLAPGSSLTLKLPSMDFPATRIFPQLHVKRGDRLTVSWSIAGVPTATATARIG